jgi:hypothetical protein
MPISTLTVESSYFLASLLCLLFVYGSSFHVGGKRGDPSRVNNSIVEVIERVFNGKYN